MKPNQKVLDAMLNNAFRRFNFPLLSLICDAYRTYNLSLTEVSLQRIEKFLLEIRSKILVMVRRTSLIFYQGKNEIGFV